MLCRLNVISASTQQHPVVHCRCLTSSLTPCPAQRSTEYIYSYSSGSFGPFLCMSSLFLMISKDSCTWLLNYPSVLRGCYIKLPACSLIISFFSHFLALIKIHTGTENRILCYLPVPTSFIFPMPCKFIWNYLRS